jgi:hypothetical protein
VNDQIRLEGFDAFRDIVAVSQIDFTLPRGAQLEIVAAAQRLLQVTADKTF